MKTSNRVCKDHRDKKKAPDPVVKDLSNKLPRTNNVKKRSRLTRSGKYIILIFGKARPFVLQGISDTDPVKTAKDLTAI